MPASSLSDAGIASDAGMHSDARTDENSGLDTPLVDQEMIDSLVDDLAGRTDSSNIDDARSHDGTAWDSNGAELDASAIELALFDSTMPDTTMPDTNMPDSTMPDTNMPDSTMPDTNMPDTNMPDSTMPDTTMPDTNMPDSTMPDTNMPDTNMPDVTLVDACVPQTCEELMAECGEIDDGCGRSLQCGSCPTDESCGGGGQANHCGTCYEQAVLSTANVRGGNDPVFSRTHYDYAPSILYDGKYRMWWCGGVAGDYILYAEAESPEGPWHRSGSLDANSYDIVFRPTGVVGDFDETHSCDPSVIRVKNKYYMYYGGKGENDTLPITRIGVAQSDDGLNWTRLNNGQAIISPARNPEEVSNAYGAGQPSALYYDDNYYLIYTDTTGLGINPGNGAGQFVLRSPDPTFQTDVESLTAQGFEPRTANNQTAFSLLQAFSVDWMFVDALNRFAIAIDKPANNLSVRFFC